VACAGGRWPLSAGRLGQPELDHTADGSPGPDGGGDFKAEPGRYHLCIAINCPWAHRTLIMRHLKGFEDVVSLSIVLPRRTEEGWVFDNESAKHRDACLGTSVLREVYTMADPTSSGWVAVPVLWDKARRTIVNNESAEIIRTFNSAFAALTDDEHDYYPSSLRAEIEAINARIYKTLNNGIYRTGFARPGRGGRRGLRDPRLAQGAARRAAPSDQRYADRSRLAIVPDLGPL